MGQAHPRPRRRFQPQAERMEERSLLSLAHPSALTLALRNPFGYHAVRPNTPVLPFGAQAADASFLDPTVHITNGNHVIVGRHVFAGPFAHLDAATGFIKIGDGSDVLDNAIVIATPRGRSSSTIFIGEKVSLSPGAVILGPSTVGAYGTAAQPTLIGANALIDGATIEPGAIVSALARVGPGVTVPTGFRVLPGKNVTTDAEASDPKLGKVVAVKASEVTDLNSILSDNMALAQGYTTLYQGNKETGTSPGVPSAVTNVFNGNLAAVEGASLEPGSAIVKFEPTQQGPQFLAHNGTLLEALIPTFPARVTGQALFHDRAQRVARHVGFDNSIRADEGQPLSFASFLQTGHGVTIHSPVRGELEIGSGVFVDTGGVILAGPLAKSTSKVTIGDNVSIGPGAVVDRSSIGSGSSIGARAYVEGSTLPAGSVVPPGTVIVNDRVVGVVEW